MKNFYLKKYLGIFIIIIFGLLIIGTKTVSQSDHSFIEREKRKSIRPNIILILADDLGYGDLGGYYGGKAKTPNLNRLAHEGLLFTDFHSNGPMCSPTRAALLTGRYQQRLGIERALPTDWHDKGIGDEENKNEITIAEYLKKEGYRTGFFGKWHLGKHQSANPTLHGFDEFRGLTCGCGDYFSKIDRNGYEDWWHNKELNFQEGYTTNVITNNAINFIKSNTQKPFFLYVAHLAVHFPWQTPEDETLEVRRKGEDFTSVFPGPHSKLGPHSPEDVPSVLIQMIEELDSEVGRINETLRKEGLDDNTFVFFTSDNGGYLNYNGTTWPNVGSNGILRGQKGQVYEGGHRVPAIAWWPGKIAPLSVCDETALSFDILPTILDILEVPFPEKNGPNSIDGISLKSLLLENKITKSRTLFWRMSNQKAVRSGDWKLISTNENYGYELYNLKNDIGETNNLSSKYPEIVLQLKLELEKWEKNVKNK